MISVIVYVGDPLDNIQLSFNPPGSFCPSGQVNFTCETIESGGVLNWVVNDAVHSTFSFRPEVVDYPTPLTVITPLDGVVASVINATSTAYNATTNIYNITSMLSVSNVSVLNGSSLDCEALAPGVRSRSNVLNIEVNDLG